MRYRNCSTRLGMPAIALAIALGTAAAAQAQTTVCLVAKPFTATGAAAGVPMWGYALGTGDATTCSSAVEATSPGPRITLPPGGTTLTIYLKNELPVATSLVIPGLPSAPAGFSPERVSGRARSFTTEVAPDSVGTYTWTVGRPGTFMYQSGSHVQVQIQMGLFGALTKDSGPNEAYAGASYGTEVVLFYSEIDPVLHASVYSGNYQGLITIPATGQMDAPVMSSTYNYKPRYFLVNGDAYPGSSTAIEAGGAGTTTLIRFLNAGLRTHVPTLLNGDFELVAEDAHKYGYARRQVQISLLANKTMDVLWTPASAGTYPIFDRTPHLTTTGDGPGGMIVNLAVGGTVSARDNTYGARYDKTLTVAAPGVLGNDSATLGAVLGTGPSCMTGFTLNADGSFVYTFDVALCPAYPTSDSFTYSQTGSNVATVTINLSANAAPVATDGEATTDEDTPVAISLQATDPNSDPLTFAIGTPPANGTLSGTPPNLTYTPLANYKGADSFTFTATEAGGGLTSAPATVNITVAPVNDAPVAAPLLADRSWSTPEDTAVVITLSGTDVDGDSLTFTITTPPANGSLSGITQVTPTTATVIYTPRLDYFGTDTFRIVANDGAANSPVATISVSVAAAADNPIAVDDAYSTKYNASLTMNVLANDKDPDGTPLTIFGSFPKCFSMPPAGSTVGTEVPCTGTGQDRVTLNSSLNRLTLVPNPLRPPNNVGGFRTFKFQYQAKDAGGALSTAPGASVTVRVNR